MSPTSTMISLGKPVVQNLQGKKIDILTKRWTIRRAKRMKLGFSSLTMLALSKWFSQRPFLELDVIKQGFEKKAKARPDPWKLCLEV